MLGGGSELTELSQGCVDPTSPHLVDIGRSSKHCTFVPEFGYLAAFSNAGGSKLSDVLNDALFDPLWKLGEGWARSLYQLLKLYLRPNLRNTFDVRPLGGCWARRIDKKEESSWVKFKAFPTNVGGQKVRHREVPRTRQRKIEIKWHNIARPYLSNSCVIAKFAGNRPTAIGVYPPEVMEQVPLPLFLFLDPSLPPFFPFSIPFHDPSPFLLPLSAAKRPP